MANHDPNSIRLMRLLGLHEIRSPADSRQGESGAKPGAVAKHCRHRGDIQWVETERTEGPAAQTGEPRIPVRVQQEPGRSQSPHNSDEAGNDRGAKEGRQVEAGRKYNCKSNCRECRRLNQAERYPPNGNGPKQRCGLNVGGQPSKEESRRACGKDHQKWPHAYFAELGLISLALTRAQAANARPETH